MQILKLRLQSTNLQHIDLFHILQSLEKQS